MMRLQDIAVGSAVDGVAPIAVAIDTVRSSELNVRNRRKGIRNGK